MGVELGAQEVKRASNWVSKLHFLGARPALKFIKYKDLAIKPQRPH